MESSVRYILLIVGALIIVGILWDGLRRKKRQEREAPIGTIDLKRVKEKMPDRKISPTFVLPDREDDIVSEVRIQGQSSCSQQQSDIEPQVETVMQPEPAIVVEEIEKTVEPIVQAKKPIGPLVQDDFVLLHVKSSYDEGFSGYPLLQTLLAHKLQFGARQFFHRHEKNEAKGKVLFSVSSDVPPGTFNPTAMKDFQCYGLMLFMNARQHKAPLKVFEEMLDAAQSLAESLGGDVLINQDTPSDEAHLAQLRSELR